MKPLFALKSTAILLTLATGAGLASALAPVRSATAQTTDIHTIFSTTIQKLGPGCHCEGSMMAFDPVLTVCLEHNVVTSVHTGCY